MLKSKETILGHEVKGKKLGVIGLGAIGVLVANIGIRLGMEVYGYDPYISLDHAWHVSRHIIHATNKEEIYNECDYITLHLPSTDDTEGMINKESIEQMKDGVSILNFARNTLVNDDDIIEALNAGKVSKYVSDLTPQLLAKMLNNTSRCIN